jgi:hypothetical protein
MGGNADDLGVLVEAIVEMLVIVRESVNTHVEGSS